MTVNYKKELLNSIMLDYCEPCDGKKDGCEGCKYLEVINEACKALDLLEKQEQGLITIYDSQEVKDSVDEAIELYNKKEQGLIIELPVPIGTIVYNIEFDEVEPLFLTYPTITYVKSDWGKTIFATKEEAESRLKELRGEE